MSSIAKKIVEARKSKGLSQEELAEIAKVNLRTIQRIENNENNPRGKTLILVCNALELKIENISPFDLTQETRKRLSVIIDSLFIAILNIILNSIIGYLTLDSNANTNSRIGALLLSFFIPFYICYQTEKLSRTSRVLKFGHGYLAYLITSIILVGIPKTFVCGLLPCLTISIAILYYGDILLKKNKNRRLSTKTTTYLALNFL
jgi:transcriptional regulator with XRE-family HTH domain